MTTIVKRAVFVSFVTLLLGGSLGAQAGQGGFASAGSALAPQTFGLGLNKAAMAEEPKSVRLAPSQRTGVQLGRVPALHLAPVDRDRLFAEDAVAPYSGETKVLRIGVGRALDLDARDGAWYTLAGGSKLWAVEIVGDGALGLRLSFSNLALPPGAELAVYAPDLLDADQQYREFGRTPAEAAEEIEFLEAGAAAKAGAEPLWTRVIFGERVRVELYLPASLADDTVLPFAVDHAQYLYRDPLLDTTFDKAAGSCHNDVSCSPDWAQVARGVARFSFVRGGKSYLCTGQLLNNQRSDFTPYFLTANHCLSANDTAAATSAVFFWLYQTATCNGAPPALANLKQSTSATVLSASPSSDYSLLMINGVVPTNLNLLWEGWNAADLARNPTFGPYAYTIAGTSAGTRTGLQAAPGDQFTVTATGTVNTLPTGGGEGTATPDGNPYPCVPTCLLPSAHFGALIGKFGPTGPWFFIGSQKTFTADRAGELILAVDDSIHSDNVGSFAASVSLRGNVVACIHHPAGDYKRISFGTTATASVLDCGSSNHFRVNWTNGPTEPGSSGGGAFLNSTKQLVGQLHCGRSACGSVTSDSFGSFSSTYPKIAGLLAGGADDSSEDNDTCPVARTVTAGTLMNRVVKIGDEDWYRIVVPANKTLKVTLSFTNSFGDIDLRAFRNCSGTGGGTQVVSSLSHTNSEVISWKNTGNAAVTIFWRVYLFNDTRNNYNITTQVQ